MLKPFKFDVTAIEYSLDPRFDAPTNEVVYDFFLALAEEIKTVLPYAVCDEYGITCEYRGDTYGIHFSESDEGRRALTVRAPQGEVTFASFMDTIGVPPTRAMLEQAKRCARYMRGEGYNSQFSPALN